ncbi:MAG: lipoate--protein ligase family protein [Verrucomicrobiota bacterium]
MFETWFLSQTGLGEPAWNMALDEALLESRTAQPVLRFYSWSEPAATFGYSQHYSAVEPATTLRPLIRRLTGGGLVPHDADWTYSLIFPPAHSWYELKATESYERVHQWVRRSFRKMEVTTELASEKKTEIPGQCFVGWEKSDLLWHGKKIAGAAQRRTKNGLLIQGSIQPPPIGLAKADWQKAMCDSVGSAPVRWEEFVATRELSIQAEILVEEKYAKKTYNQKR